MKCKYFFQSHPVDQCNQLGSTTWQRMCKVKELTENHLRWIIWKGCVFFRKDCWSDLGRVGDLIPMHKIEDPL